LSSVPRRSPDPRRSHARADPVIDRYRRRADGHRFAARFRRRSVRQDRALRDRRLCRGVRCRDPAGEVDQGMIGLLTSAEAWAALLTLTALEIVLGIDNVIFLSVLVSRMPQAQAMRARQIG